MLAYNFEKSRNGVFGFDTLNLFTNDEVYCSEFSPSSEDVNAISNFIEELKIIFPLKQNISLYIGHKKGYFLGDVKIYLGQEPTFANSSHRNLEQLLSSLKSYLIVNSVYEIETGHKYLN